jgi:hypothetical protein
MDPVFDESVDERLIDINGSRIQSVVVARIDLCRGVNVTDAQKTTGTVGRRLPIEARSDEKNPFWSIAVKPFSRSSSGLHGPREK